MGNTAIKSPNAHIVLSAGVPLLEAELSTLGLVEPEDTGSTS